MASLSDCDRRILIAAPVGRDAVLAQAVLQRADFGAEICRDLDHLSCEIEAGAGAALLSQEALVPSGTACLRASLAAQPPWSDLPVVVLASAEATTAVGEMLGESANATVLERPVSASTLVGTVRSALRARLRQYDVRDHLQARVAAEEAERRARAEAEAAVRIRDEFLAAVAHDLKNPLGAIRGYAQLLQRRVARSDALDAGSLAQGLVTIDQMVGRAVAQIDELLDLARLHAGQALPLDLRPTDLVALVDRVAQVYQETTTRHRLRVERAAAEVVGVWDAIRLERVLGNLLSNAIKYSPEGGEIVLTVAEETRGRQTWATLTVRDQGIGIPPSDLPHIFERFYRASNAPVHVSGTGLGLAGSRQIVEQHGGTIAATGAEGGGTVFIVRLPIFQMDRVALSAEGGRSGA